MSYYKCDPRKHPPCEDDKICQRECFLTTNPSWSTDGEELTEEEVNAEERRRNEKRKEFFEHIGHDRRRDQTSDQGRPQREH